MTDENPASSPLQHPNRASRSSRGCTRQSGAPRSCRSPALLQGDSPHAPGGPSSRRHEQIFLHVLLQMPFVWVPEDLPGCHLHPSSLQAAPRAEGAAYLCLCRFRPDFPLQSSAEGAQAPPALTTVCQAAGTSCAAAEHPFLVPPVPLPDTGLCYPHPGEQQKAQ